MKHFEIIEFLLGSKANFYAVKFTDKEDDEFTLYLKEHSQKPEFAEKVQLIVDTIDRMARIFGARVNYFKDEGPNMVFRIKINDDAQHPLRVYCLRYNSEIVILGNGGYKDLDTVATQDKEELDNAVRVLIAVDKTLCQDGGRLPDLSEIINVEFELKGY